MVSPDLVLGVVKASLDLANKWTDALTPEQRAAIATMNVEDQQRFHALVAPFFNWLTSLLPKEPK